MWGTGSRLFRGAAVLLWGTNLVQPTCALRAHTLGSLVELDQPGASVDRERLAVADALGGVHEHHDGSHAVLAGDEGRVGREAAAVGDHCGRAKRGAGRARWPAGLRLCRAGRCRRGRG